jgi:hypothetical protein
VNDPVFASRMGGPLTDGAINGMVKRSGRPMRLIIERPQRWAHRSGVGAWSPRIGWAATGEDARQQFAEAWRVWLARTNLREAE